jgi:hypothetical protein
VKTFASRYKLEYSRNSRGQPRWRIRDVVYGNLLSPTAIFGKRQHALWSLIAKRTLETREAGLTDRDLLDIKFRVMNKREIRKRGQSYHEHNRRPMGQ